MSYIWTAIVASFVTLFILNIAHHSSADQWVSTAWTLVFVQAAIGVVTFLYGCHINKMGFWNEEG